MFEFLLLVYMELRAGDTTPARAVDIVASEPSAVLIDIRSAREKQAVGVPDVPGSARGRFIELEMAEIERRLRGQLKNVDAVEAQVRSPVLVWHGTLYNHVQIYLQHVACMHSGMSNLFVRMSDIIIAFIPSRR
jgi:hypothetical protein